MTESLIDNYRKGHEVRVQKFIKLVTNPFKYKLFLFMSLPMALIAGLSVKKMGMMAAVVSVPYRHINKNPFKSTYFAVLSMAAEMSTGLLAMMLIRNAVPHISMLVTNIEGEFSKKAVSTTFFECQDGIALNHAVEQCILSGAPVTFRALSIGTNSVGIEIARFYITWSFRVKS